MDKTTYEALTRIIAVANVGGYIEPYDTKIVTEWIEEVGKEYENVDETEANFRKLVEKCICQCGNEHEIEEDGELLA